MILIGTNRRRRRPIFVFVTIDPINIFKQDTTLCWTDAISEREVSLIHSRQKKRTNFYRFNDDESLPVMDSKSSSLLELRIRRSFET
jgi:hypothetical protein